ncbi:fimbrial protein [Serratia silvae]|uniref:Fimbrial protein n=1 Tax=Serratia silvae TaxID=2824122 RepID=A0ABT0KDN2_9GAMM|nr:fimbrial protein [Serratia silvae]MCL1030131.1 fimbrial protein [Serratia silvae]
MNKNLIAVAVLAASAFTSQAVIAADGTVNFTGTIIETGCEMSSTIDDLTVPMGTIAASAFNGAGSTPTGNTASSGDFKIRLINCPTTVSKAAVRFDGVSVDGNDSVLALTQGAGVATGVGIQITDPANKVVSMHKDSTMTTLSHTEENVLKFVARYYATAAKVEAGTANAAAAFTIQYERD